MKVIFTKCENFIYLLTHTGSHSKPKTRNKKSNEGKQREKREKNERTQKTQGQAMAKATRKVISLTTHVTYMYTPSMLAPRPPDVCEKNVFCFIRASASGKPHFFTIFTNSFPTCCLQIQLTSIALGCECL